MNAINPMLSTSTSQKPASPQWFAAVNRSPGGRDGFIEILAKTLNGKVQSEEDFLRDIASHADTEFTLVLALDSNEAGSYNRLCREAVRNGGIICPVVLVDRAILIGPLRSASVSNACPQCLLFRIRQGRNRGAGLEPKDALQSWAAWGSSSLCGIVAGLIQYKLSSDEPIRGRCWMLKTGSLELASTHIVKSPNCPLCSELGAVPASLSTRESFQ